ncbi:putative retroelement polyprotein, partial [Puccinia sorghi]
MTANANLFISLDHSEEGVVRTSSGNEALKIKGIGTIKLVNELGTILLKKVLYVPQLAVNLLSVQCLVLDNFCVNFEINSFHISNSSSIVMRGNYVANLPTLEFKNLLHSSLYSPSELLHKSLGHDFNSCEASSKPFEELHMDLVGPISPPSQEGHKYFLTIVDSCTRFCSAIPVKHKSDISDAIEQA